MVDAQGSRDAIATFVAALEPNLVGHARSRRRLAEEMRGHLEDAAERHRERGLSWAEAQRKAIEDFGPPEVVVAGWAESKGVGVPTTFTRYAGLAGVVGTLGLAVSLIYQSASWEYSRGSFAEVSLSFVALLALSFAGLYMRVRGKLIPYGRLGPWVALVGFILMPIGSAMWFAPLVLLGFIALCVGLAAYFFGAMRSGVIPRWPIAIWIAGIAATFVVRLTLAVIGIDGGVFVPLIGLTSFAVGWVGLGLHLWNENTGDAQIELAGP